MSSTVTLGLETGIGPVLTALTLFFAVWGLGLKVQGFEIRAFGLGLKVQGLGFRA